jgi:hypothetical protein
MIPKSIAARLAALEAARRPAEHKPVDEELLIGRLQLFLAGRNHNKHVLSTRLAANRHRDQHESGLTAYARDVGYADEGELFRVAFTDRAEFERRHLGTLSTRDPHIIGVERTRLAERAWLSVAFRRSQIPVPPFQSLHLRHQLEVHSLDLECAARSRHRRQVVHGEYALRPRNQ